MVPGGLRITSPAPGTSVAPGDALRVTVVPDRGRVVSDVLVVGPGMADWVERSPFTVDLTVPDDVSGPIEIVAFARDSSGDILRSSPLALRVDSRGALQAIEILPRDPVLAGGGVTLQLRVNGHFSDGSIADLAQEGQGTEFLAAVPQIATVSPTGLITAQGPGTTTLRVRNRGIEKTTTVTVLDGGCFSAPQTLCLNRSRFKVEVQWKVPGSAGAGTAVPLTGDTGYFWFFNPANVELVVKVLDGTGLNGRFWVFYGALSDVEYAIKVTDTVTGQTKTYQNPQGRLASFADVSAFPASSAAAPATDVAGLSREVLDQMLAGLVVSHPGEASREVRIAGAAAKDVIFEPAASCGSTPTRLCLQSLGFQVEVTWKNPATGATGAGQAVKLTGDTGYFWFFGPENVELIVKVLDGRALNGHFWVFYGALSNVEYTITIRRVVTGETRQYKNPANSLASRADTEAF